MIVCLRHLGHMTKMAATPIYGKNPSKIFLTYFGNLGFSMEKVKTVDFSETIAACDLNVGSCRQLIEFMKVCEY